MRQQFFLRDIFCNANIYSHDFLKKLGMELKNLKDDFLIKNSVFNALTRISSMGIGFLFWLIASRTFTIDSVGKATVIISSILLIGSISRFGFDSIIIRYINIENKRDLYSTCILVVSIITIFIASIYFLNIGYFIPSLPELTNISFFLIFITVIYSIYLTLTTFFLALRNSFLRLILFSSLIIQLPLLYLSPHSDYLDIFFVFSISYATVTSIFFIYTKWLIGFEFKINKNFLKTSLHYNFMNYLSSIFQQVPTLLMPLLAINLLGAKDAALCYIGYAIGNIAVIIPDAVGNSYFVEGAHGIDLKKGLKKSLILIYFLLIPIIILIIVFGNYLLSFFGPQYNEAYNFIIIISLSSLFMGIYCLYGPMQYILFNLNNIVLINFFRSVMILTLSYILALNFGLNGLAWAWFTANCIISFIILFLIIHYKDRFFGSVSKEP